jgi:hypothetical protein
MFYTIELTENSKLIAYSVSQNRIQAITELSYNLGLNKYNPAKESTVCITIKQHYFDQYGKKQTKYKQGKFSYFKYFTIHSNEFSMELLKDEMNQRFLKD